MIRLDVIDSKSRANEENKAESSSDEESSEADDAAGALWVLSHNARTHEPAAPTALLSPRQPPDQVDPAAAPTLAPQVRLPRAVVRPGCSK